MINKSSIKGIFFDLYGTLLICKDLPAAWNHWFSTFYESLKRHGLPLSEDEFKKKCDNFFGRQEPKIQKANFTVFEKRILSTCNDIKLTLNEQEIHKIASSCVKAWEGYMQLDSEAPDVLRTLKKQYNLALISNFDHPPHVHTLLRDLKLNTLFDSITISAEVGFKKPDPSIFSFALEETGLDPSNCIYVGDENIDSIAASAAGMHSITIKRQLYNQSQNNSFYKSNLNVKNESRGIIHKLSTLLEILM